MDIGIGLPSTIPGIPGRLILQWASAAEQAGFSSLGTLDRIVYSNLETVPTLAAAAAVTERIGLTTAILIGPYRGNGALLAKQLATVDAIAGGRLRVGIAQARNRAGTTISDSHQPPGKIKANERSDKLRGLSRMVQISLVTP
jgi:alkanesulfonate monooxygenase SsuD/methylene tetrahydromethanopterin reductase-like flavin-dependent oxidoreductase (luciferase family)